MKSWYTSKTLWTNTMAVLGGVWAYTTTGDVAPLAVAVLGLINMGLRLVTGQPIGTGD